MRTPADLKKATTGELQGAYIVETRILAELMIAVAFAPRDPANRLAVAYSEDRAATLLIELAVRSAATDLDQLVKVPNRA